MFFCRDNNVDRPKVFADKSVNIAPKATDSSKCDSSRPTSDKIESDEIFAESLSLQNKELQARRITETGLIIHCHKIK